jgi:hypothetical protein
MNAICCLLNKPIKIVDYLCGSYAVVPVQSTSSIFIQVL